MTTATIPNTITAGADVEAVPLAENFAALADHINLHTIDKDGSTAMTAALTLADGNPAASEQYVDDATDALVPPGTIVLWAGSTTPSGYLYLEGADVSRSTYANLFAAIGTQFGAGNGSTTFGLPDMRGRSPFGYDSGNSRFNVLGETGGYEDGQIINHVHDVEVNPPTTTTSSDTHHHAFQSGRSVWTQTGSGSASGIDFSPKAGSFSFETETESDTHDHTLNIGPFTETTDNPDGGVSAAGRNLPPYIAMRFMIKT